MDRHWHPKHQFGLIAPYEGAHPTVPASVFVAPGATVIGDVVIGEESSIWYNAVVRGDVHFIRIGRRTNIQDNAVVHVTHDTHPTCIGDEVTIGHCATIHGCTLESRCLVGIGAIILDGALVESGAMVAAGALVPPGMRVPSGKLVAGVPAKPLRDLRPREIADLAASAERYVAYASRNAAALSTR